MRSLTFPEEPVISLAKSILLVVFTFWPVSSRCSNKAAFPSGVFGSPASSSVLAISWERRGRAAGPDGEAQAAMAAEGVVPLALADEGREVLEPARGVATPRAAAAWIAWSSPTPASERICTGSCGAVECGASAWVSVRRPGSAELDGGASCDACVDAPRPGLLVIARHIDPVGRFLVTGCLTRGGGCHRAGGPCSGGRSHRRGLGRREGSNLDPDSIEPRPGE